LESNCCSTLFDKNQLIFPFQYGFFFQNFSIEGTQKAAIIWILFPKRKRILDLRLFCVKISYFIGIYQNE